MYSNEFKSFSLLRCSPYRTEKSKEQRIRPTLRTWNSYMLFCQHSPVFIRNTQVNREVLAGFVRCTGANGTFIQEFLNLWVWAACPECWNIVGHMLSWCKLSYLIRVTLNYTETAPDPQCSKRCQHKTTHLKPKTLRPLVNSWNPACCSFSSSVNYTPYII